LEADAPEGEPLVGRHALDVDLLGVAVGVEFGNEAEEELFEFFRIFAGDNGAA